MSENVRIVELTNTMIELPPGDSQIVNIPIPVELIAQALFVPNRARRRLEIRDLGSPMGETLVFHVFGDMINRENGYALPPARLTPGMNLTARLINISRFYTLYQLRIIVRCVRDRY